MEVARPRATMWEVHFTPCVQATRASILPFRPQTGSQKSARAKALSAANNPVFLRELRVLLPNIPNSKRLIHPFVIPRRTHPPFLDQLLREIIKKA